MSKTLNFITKIAVLIMSGGLLLPSYSSAYPNANRDPRITCMIAGILGNGSGIESKIKLMDDHLGELGRGDFFNTQKTFSKILQPFSEGDYRALSFKGAGSVGFYQRPSDGLSRIVKVLNIEVTPLMTGPKGSGYRRKVTWVNGPAFPYGEQSLASSVLMAIRGNLLVESLGGPKVLRVGTWDHAATGKKYLAIEMENKFSDQETTNVKDITENKTGRLLLSNPRTVRNVGQKMASMFAQAIKNGIIPIDAQFLVTRNGDVSWIDGDQWLKVSIVNGNYDWDHFSSFVLMDFVALFQKSPTLGKGVFNSLLTEIHKLPMEKQTPILNGLKSNLGHLVWVNGPELNSKRVQIPFRQLLNEIGIAFN